MIIMVIPCYESLAQMCSVEKLISANVQNSPENTFDEVIFQ